MSCKTLTPSVSPLRKFSRHKPQVLTVEDALRWGKLHLKVLGKIEAQASVERLLEEILGLDRLRLYLEPKRPLPGSSLRQFSALVEERRKRIPLDYLLGQTHFWNEVLEVGPGCLIPRPSTEVLVEKFIEKSGFRKDAAFSFLDLGCGSGAIGIALLRYYPNAKAVFADVSAEALKMTRKNLKRYALLSRAGLKQSDLFESFKKTGKPLWDAVISNPPYLSAHDLKIAQPEVLKEPRVALSGGPDGLGLYRSITARAPDYLKPSGLLVFEMGKGQASKIKKFCSESFHSIEVFKDYARIDRVLMARFNG